MIFMTLMKFSLSLSLFILALNAQSLRVSQETMDAIQNQEIQMLKARADDSRIAVDKLIQEQLSMRSAMDRFTGIGIGFGATLTVLQLAQLIMQIQKRVSANREVSG